MILKNVIIMFNLFMQHSMNYSHHYTEIMVKCWCPDLVGFGFQGYYVTQRNIPED